MNNQHSSRLMPTMKPDSVQVIGHVTVRIYSGLDLVTHSHRLATNAAKIESGEFLGTFPTLLQAVRAGGGE